MLCRRLPHKHLLDMLGKSPQKALKSRATAVAAMFTAHWCTLLVIMQGSCMVPWAAAEPAGEHCQDDAVQPGLSGRV